MRLCSPELQAPGSLSGDCRFLALSLLLFPPSSSPLFLSFFPYFCLKFWGAGRWNNLKIRDHSRKR